MLTLFISEPVKLYSQLKHEMFNVSIRRNFFIFSAQLIMLIMWLDCTSPTSCHRGNFFCSAPLLRTLTPKRLSAHKYRIGIAVATASIQHSNSAQQEPGKHELPIKGKGDHDQPILLVLTSTHAVA